MQHKKEIKINKENIIVILIFIIAIISRIYSWPNAIEGINCDEAMTAINAKAIAETGKDMYGTSLPVYFEAWLIAGQSALLTYFMAICIKVFGFTIFAIRLPMLVISIASLFIFYKLMKLIFKDKKIAIIILSILAINPWHIMQSIWSLDCNLFPHFLLLSIFALTKGMKEENLKLIYFSMVLFGITTYSYGIALYAVPIFLSIYMIIGLKNKQIKVKQVAISAMIVIAVALPLIIMSFINLFDLQSLKIGPITIQNFTYSIRTNDMLIFSDNIFEQFCKNFMTLFTLIIVNNDGLEWNSIFNIGTIYMGSIVFAIIGIIYLIKDKSIDKNSKSIVLIWLAVSVILGILINNVNINRLNIIWYPFVILIGFGIYKVLEDFHYKKICVGIIVLIYVLGFTNFIVKLHSDYSETIKNSWTWDKGFVNVLNYAKSLNKNIVFDSEILKNDKNIIFSIYTVNYSFKEQGFLDYKILLNCYLDIYNTNIIEILNKIKVEDFEGNILENNIYIINKNNLADELNLDEYEINKFNEYYLISKR